MNRWWPLFAALAVALVATAGSLFFSEVMKLPPCVLCWYQRIAMYPLIPILALGLVLEDARCALYATALLLPGLVTAVYHNLLYYGVLPESVSPCTQGISCTSKQIEWFGFITIPSLSLVGFVLIAACLWAFHRSKRKETLA